VRRRSDAPALPSLEDWTAESPGRPRILSREEFAATYGAAPADLERVEEFARANGLTVVENNAARRTVVVSGSVVRMNGAFAVELRRYESPRGAYRGHEGPIGLPDDVAGVVEGVFGLDNRRIGGHNSIVSGDPPHTTRLTPPQVAGLYNFPCSLATGQTIGIIEFGGGYRASDIQLFYNALGAGFTAPTIVEVGIDGASNTPGFDHVADGEVIIDICVASSVAQGATLAVYFAPLNQQGWVDALARAIHPGPDDPKPSVLSLSWYLSAGDDPHAMAKEKPPVLKTDIEAISCLFQEAAVVGLTVFVVAGDLGSDSGVGDGKAHVQYPASDPWVTSCGGTTIGNVAGSSFIEATWNDTFVLNDRTLLTATGGGISDFFELPPYQRGACVPTSVNDRHRGRGVPDVAGNASANSGYTIWVGGVESPVPGCGTSAVVPLYAGLAALLNASLGEPVGFLNPLLYALGASSGVFRDINDGAENALNGAPGYASGPGWDACTGWGSINGIALLCKLLEFGRGHS
jgi:kumamolisin